MLALAGPEVAKYVVDVVDFHFGDTYVTSTV
jgi:hypothetical protein